MSAEISKRYKCRGINEGAPASPHLRSKRDFNNIVREEIYFSLYLILLHFLLQANAPVVAIDGHENVPVNDEDALLKAVVNQPVSVAIEAGGPDFQFYSEGVFTGECGTDLDHGVAIVGYGTTLDGTKYWIVRNSWGAEWGEKGYVRMQRGITKKHGQCGIAMEASYPIKKSSNNPGDDESESTIKDEL